MIICDLLLPCLLQLLLLLLLPCLLLLLPCLLLPCLLVVMVVKGFKLVFIR
jgi:hypothetical protein